MGPPGGIASGKTAVARRLAEHGAVHIDADELAREVVAPGTPGLAAIAERFGQGGVRAAGPAPGRCTRPRGPRRDRLLGRAGPTGSELDHPSRRRAAR